MDEFEDFNEFEDNEPIEGQICYDELEPIIEVEKKQLPQEIEGQLGIDELKPINLETNFEVENSHDNNKVVNNQVFDEKPKSFVLNEKNEKETKIENNKAFKSFSNETNNDFVFSANNSIEKEENPINEPKVIKNERSQTVNIVKKEIEPKETQLDFKKENISYENKAALSEESILDEIDRDRQQREQPKFRREKQIKLDLSEADGSGIIITSLEDVLHNSMIPYTEHVVLDRALPRVEDGLKPVQRRILYTMLELGLQPDKPFRKSARIVGDCMGKYHPHGDSSVYDAMVRMAQDYSLREPLVLGHGNFGSIDGDSAAAMRYTEAKLTPLAMELLRDLDKNTVRWMLNFDDTLKEPAMLPGRFPNLLVNGAYGIAVGVATNIPPHNLSEVIEGIIAYIDHPKISLEEMMKIIKGPDFPTGGIVIAGDELKEAYRTGKGKILLKARTHIEEKGDLSFFSSVGFSERPDTVCGKIAEGRIAILVDGTPTALIVPYLFIEYFQTIDDYAERPYFATLTRWLKYLSFFIATLLPGLYVALAVFNPEVFPDRLISKIAYSIAGTPFPLMLETLIIHFIYEIMREAGLRLPRPLGHAVSIVGGLVIGETAVNAGLIGAPTLMVVALTAISSYVIPNLYEPTAILRLIFILVGGILGIWGVMLLFSVLIVNICSKSNFGIPFVSPIAPFDFYSMRDVITRVSWKTLSKKNKTIQNMPH